MLKYTGKTNNLKNMSREKLNLKYIISISMVSAMGGLLFGYDWVVIGGAKPFYELYFGVENNVTLQGWAMSSALLGCLLGAITSGKISDIYGRKKILILSAIFFTASAFGTGITNSLFIFIIYRIIGGIGIGMASNLSPMYISEISPANYRGRLVSLNQLTIVIGILSAQVINWLIAEKVPPIYSNSDILNSWNGQYGWRIMFWAEIIPAFLFFLLMFIVPESPRWLLKRDKNEKALSILSKIGGIKYANKISLEIQNSFKDDTSSSYSSEIFKRKYRGILVIGIVLAVFQQWCGINVIFNYAQEIFSSAGYGVSDIMFNIVVTGSVNLIFTFLALYTVDKLGRKKLMTSGAVSLAVIYLLIGLCYYLNIGGIVLLLLVVTAIALYAMSLAPVTWVLISEIFPNRIRSVAMSVSVFSLWSASFILTYTFPSLNKIMGAYGTFWLYSIICICGYIFIKSKVTETKGKSLEEIEGELK